MAHPPSPPPEHDQDRCTATKLSAAMAAMEVSSAANDGGPAALQLTAAGATDIGGGRENQDMWLSWTDPAGSGTAVLGVLDGHGRDIGRLAALTGRDHILQWLSDSGNVKVLRESPVESLGQLFESTHLAIKERFRVSLVEQGWQVEEVEEGGYLLKRRHAHLPWICVHGGSSCSLVLLLDGTRLLSANVGDSSVLLGRIRRTGGVCETLPIPENCMIRLADLASEHLHDADINQLLDGGATSSGSKKRSRAFLSMLASRENSYSSEEYAAPSLSTPAVASATTSSAASALPASISPEAPPSPSKPVAVYDRRLPVPGETFPTPTPAGATSSYLLFCAEHSPESPLEFERLRRVRPASSRERRGHPELLMVYDSPGHGGGGKAACPPIFELNPADISQLPTVLNKGRYYKNVRSEWASLISTPRPARFQDALAFTRSLGDLHLQSYGVSYLPEVFEVDLAALFSSSTSPATPMDGSPGERESVVLSLLACTDGVWDNWKFEDCINYVVDSNVLAAVHESEPPLAPGAVLTGDVPPVGSTIQSAVDRLIAENARLSRRNFGSSADNATAILAYLWR
uniref:PPM-type phosphatase domain-containing protein n=1 Tax=Rhizochromulina marina TaxID=1034831 RepID=A0A7S2RFN5_9STRA